MADTRLLREPVLVIFREPDAPVRWALKLIVRRDMKTGNAVLGAKGERIGSVREIKHRWGGFNLPDLELELLDAYGAVVLALQADGGTLHVADQTKTDVGFVDWRNHWDNVRGHRLTDMDVRFCGPDGEVGRLLPRLPPQRFQDRGKFEIADASGSVVAHIAWPDIIREVVQLPDNVREPLRSLVIAFACAQVDLDWITYEPSRNVRR